MECTLGKGRGMDEERLKKEERWEDELKVGPGQQNTNKGRRKSLR